MKQTIKVNNKLKNYWIIEGKKEKFHTLRETKEFINTNIQDFKEKQNIILRIKNGKLYSHCYGISYNHCYYSSNIEKDFFHNVICFTNIVKEIPILSQIQIDQLNSINNTKTIIRIDGSNITLRKDLFMLKKPIGKYIHENTIDSIEKELNTIYIFEIGETYIQVGYGAMGVVIRNEIMDKYTLLFEKLVVKTTWNTGNNTIDYAKTTKNKIRLIFKKLIDEVNNSYKEGRTYRIVKEDNIFTENVVKFHKNE